jgi:hypothetical protein
MDVKLKLLKPVEVSVPQLLPDLHGGNEVECATMKHTSRSGQQRRELEDEHEKLQGGIRM